MSSKPPLDVFIAVLDGADPVAWPLWDHPFENDVADFFATERYIPTDVKHLAVKLRFLLHSEEKLHEREGDAWNAVIGVLVDACGGQDEREKAASRVVRLCQALPPATEANKSAYGGLRFQMCLLLDHEVLGAERQMYVDFGYQLKVRAEDILARNVHYDIADSSRMLRSILKSFELDLIECRRSRLRRAA
jgi:hypothetical protein